MTTSRARDHARPRDRDLPPDLPVVVGADEGHSVAGSAPGPAGALRVSLTGPLTLLGALLPAECSNDDLTLTLDHLPSVLADIDLVPDTPAHEGAPGLDVLEVDHAARVVGLDTAGQGLG